MMALLKCPPPPKWVMACDVLNHFQQYILYNVEISFIDGRNQSIERKPLTCCKSLTYFNKIKLNEVHFATSRLRWESTSQI